MIARKLLEERLEKLLVDHYTDRERSTCEGCREAFKAQQELDHLNKVDLYRVLIEVHSTPLISKDSRWYKRGAEPAWTRYDVIVWAEDQADARRVALAEFRDRGDRRRIVKDSVVAIEPSHPGVVMQQLVTW